MPTTESDVRRVDLELHEEDVAPARRYVAELERQAPRPENDRGTELEDWDAALA